MDLAITGTKPAYQVKFADHWTIFGYPEDPNRTSIRMPFLLADGSYKGVLYRLPECAISLL